MARYRAKYRELKVPMESSYKKEVNGQIITVQGQTIAFHNFIYETEDEKEEKFLDEHPMNGKTFVKIDEKALKGETEEEKKARLQKELEELEKEEKKPKPKETGDEPKPDLDEMSYSELQDEAKKRDIKANQSTEILKKEIKEAMEGGKEEENKEEAQF